MITGRTTIIIREAPSATSTTPPATISSRSVIAEATARPRGTASSPLMSAGGSGLRGRWTCAGASRPGWWPSWRWDSRRPTGQTRAAIVRAPMPALIFDLDGTLVDTVYAHVFAWQRALARCGLAIDGWRIHRRIGMSGGLFTRAVARELGRELTDEEAAEVQDVHGELFRELLPERRPLPGAARAARRTCARRDVTHGIATSGRRPEIDASLEALGVPPETVVVERGDVARAKPEPDLFVECARRLAADPATATWSATRSGTCWPRAARGMLSIGLLSGGYGADELERAGAYRVYRDAAELRVSLDELGVG